MQFKEDLDKMKQMADQDEIIDGIFKPMKDGYLGDGSFSFMWKGSNLTKQPTIFR